MTDQHNKAGWVESVIREFLNRPGENTLWPDRPEQCWGEPLVGFSRGDDSLFQAFKEHVGSMHWTPQEAFGLAFPERPAQPGEITVICWILPKSMETKKDNRKETTCPSERWARSRTFGEEVNVRLRHHLVATLQEKGYDAAAPSLSPFFTWEISEKYGFSSTWSERHMAFASGLGTFGLCDGLITPAGKAMRTGSIVARIGIPATPRPYTSHTEYCLFRSGGTCGKCMERCPVGAITPEGHDKMKCFEHVFKTVIPYIKTRYRFDGYSCGLCQTGVPCESRIPFKK